MGDAEARGVEREPPGALAGYCHDLGFLYGVVGGEVAVGLVVGVGRFLVLEQAAHAAGTDNGHAVSGVGHGCSLLFLAKLQYSGWACNVYFHFALREGCQRTKGNLCADAETI